MRGITARFYSYNHGSVELPRPRGQSLIYDNRSHSHTLPSQETTAALASHREHVAGMLLFWNIVRVSVLPAGAKEVSS